MLELVEERKGCTGDGHREAFWSKNWRSCVPLLRVAPKRVNRKSLIKYAQTLIVVSFFRVNSKILTSKFWFSHSLISKILVEKGPGGL